MTKSDRARLDLLHRMQCVVCGAWPAEAHHIVDNGYRRLSGGHQATIPLCPWHHRGDPLADVTVTATKELLGPSLALHKRQFVARFGTERQLLARVNEIIQVWRVT